jgi:hypothetical protein
MVIADVLPADLYALLFDTMPPEEGFDIADSVKANFDPDRTAPERSRQTWMWFQREVVDGVLTPLLVARFQPTSWLPIRIFSARTWRRTRCACPNTRSGAG